MRTTGHIIVAIHCLVYNHEQYLRDCLNGFLMQRTNFRFVAIVHDDCSTDSSAVIIREYAEKYPDIFCPIYEKEKQYQKSYGYSRLLKIMDEAHRHLATLTKVNALSNIPRSIYMSAEFRRANALMSKYFYSTFFSTNLLRPDDKFLEELINQKR